jgi:hypothetical protein
MEDMMLAGDRGLVAIRLVPSPTVGHLGETEMTTPNLMQAEMLAMAMAMHINTDGRMSVSGKVKPLAIARGWGITGRSMRDVLPALVLAIQDTREAVGMDPYRNEYVEKALAPKADRQLVECPNHGGAFDCTPFCPTCEGNQEY